MEDNASMLRLEMCCGIEWKTFRSDDDKEQLHVCKCKLRRMVTGVITQPDMG